MSAIHHGGQVPLRLEESELVLVSLIIFDGLTKEFCIAAFLFRKEGYCLVSKLIELAPKILRAMFASISTLVTNLDDIVEFVSKVKMKMKTLFERYTPFISSILVYQGMEWVPTWKAIPSNLLVKVACKLRLQDGSEDKSVLDVVKQFANDKLIFTGLHFELFSFTHLMKQVHSREDHFPSGVIWPHRIQYAFDPLKTFFANRDGT
ncbi:hypothetical protein NE237_024053 [Protea cynaroides]|uniref:Uncharacterized protein n=1 Tax=Protea cynaroides TaxID=273540 RepID=A0A9Q0K522_9MAGN|nr:hypothetical protein NE237_024053 [Protea cynaroides]